METYFFCCPSHLVYISPFLDTCTFRITCRTIDVSDQRVRDNNSYQFQYDFFNLYILLFQISMVFVVVSVFLEISAVSFIMLQATPNPAEVKYQSFSSKWSKLEASLSLTDGCFDVPRKLETSGLNKQIMVWNQWARQTHMTALSVKALKQLNLELMVEATSIYSNSLIWLPSNHLLPIQGFDWCSKS